MTAKKIRFIRLPNFAIKYNSNSSMLILPVDAYLIHHPLFKFNNEI